MANSSSGAASINNGWCLNITPQAAPMITSMNSASFALGSASSFPVTATGSPTPSIRESGALPTGVSFHTSTGTLSGTPTQAGTFNIIFTASNGVGQNATQNFTLTVPKGGTETTVQSYDAATNALWSSSEVTGASAYATSTVSPVSGGGPTPTSNVTYEPLRGRILRRDGHGFIYPDAVRGQRAAIQHLRPVIGWELFFPGKLLGR
jgi:hypothetical protein